MSAQHRLAVTYRSASPWLDYEVDRLDRLAIYDLASYRAVPPATAARHGPRTANGSSSVCITAASCSPSSRSTTQTR